VPQIRSAQFQWQSYIASTGLINIGRSAQSRDPFFSRVLHLVKAPPNLTLAHDATSSKQPAGQP